MHNVRVPVRGTTKTRHAAVYSVTIDAPVGGLAKYAHQNGTTTGPRGTVTVLVAAVTVV
jgi:hypothetical protein